MKKELLAFMRKSLNWTTSNTCKKSNKSLKNVRFTWKTMSSNTKNSHLYAPLRNQSISSSVAYSTNFLSSTPALLNTRCLQEGISLLYKTRTLMSFSTNIVHQSIVKWKARKRANITAKRQENRIKRRKKIQLLIFLLRFSKIRITIAWSWVSKIQLSKYRRIEWQCLFIVNKSFKTVRQSWSTWRYWLIMTIMQISIIKISLLKANIRWGKNPSLRWSFKSLNPTSEVL